MRPPADPPSPAPPGAGGSPSWRDSAEVVWLPTADEMADLDRSAVDRGATTERTLIECAGREIARRTALRWPEGEIWGMAGSGHNGADTLVALRTLGAWGRRVRAFRAGSGNPEPDVLSGSTLALEEPDALFAAERRPVAILDGILGTGATGAPREPQAGFIRRLNALDIPLVAVDGPSGIDFTTGAVPGACVRARLTVSLGWPKLGLLRFPGRSRCGEIEAVEIGFPPPEGELSARAITGRWIARLLRPRPANAHKGTAGYAAVVAGQEGMAGACVLAVRAALRGGAGIARAVSDPGNRTILQTAVPGALFTSWDDDEARRETIEWSHAVAVGPGLGRREGRRALVAAVLSERGDRPAVVDADALTVWEGDVGELAASLRPGDVATPHPGELARLLGTSVENVLADHASAAREAADRLGCTVVAKGAPTLVARDGRPLRVATEGGAALAAGGTGDVLTGLIVAGLAAGYEGDDAAAIALAFGGLAAAAAPEAVGHVAADLPARVPGIRAAITGLPVTGEPGLLFYAPSAGPPIGDAD